MSRAVVVIGGSGFADKLKGTNQVIRTPFGDVTVLVSRIGEKDVYAIRRHGADHTVPPHMVNYWAHIAAAREVHADVIFASTAVGIISFPTYKPGDLMVCRDLIALNPTLNGRVITFFDSFKDGIHHTDMSESFSTNFNMLLLDAARQSGVELNPCGAILTVTYGPRFETPAEIRALKALGADLTGVTAAFEAILARELGIPYSVVAIGTNLAAGIGDKPLSHNEVVEAMDKKGGDVLKLLTRGIELL